MKEVLLGKYAKRIFGNVTFCKIINDFDCPVAHITQKIESVYPERIMETGFGLGLYENRMKSYESSRNCLIKIPKDADDKEVQSRLDSFNSHIYLITSNNIRDVLSETDMYRLDNYGIDIVELEDKYETQDKEGNRYSKGTMRLTIDGEVLTDDPKEFRRYVYSRTFQPDIDLREEVNIQTHILSEKTNYKLTI